MGKFISYNNEFDQELALMALAASPTPEDACAYLKEEHNIITTPKILVKFSEFRPEQYEDLRQRIAPLKEKQLAHNLLDNALYASAVTAQAVQQLQQRISENRIKPDQLSRVARDLADVQSKAVDKKLALEGRPTAITETRNAAEVIRALEAKGIVKQIGAVDD